MKLIGLLALLSLILMMQGCADAEHVQQYMTGHVYGFWGGLWHGLVIAFSFFGSLFSDEITIYAVNNSGGLYDLGFWLGVGSTTGASTQAARSKIRR